MNAQDLWDATKTVLRGNFIALNPYLKKQEKHWINNLILHLMKLEKWEQKTLKISYCSVARLCLTLRDPMNCNMPGSTVIHCLQEFPQTHVCWVGDAVQPSHPLSPPSPPAFNLSTVLLHRYSAVPIVLSVSHSQSWSDSLTKLSFSKTLSISSRLSIYCHIAVIIFIIVSYDPLYFCIVCCNLSFFNSNSLDLILLSFFLIKLIIIIG